MTSDAMDTLPCSNPGHMGPGLVVAALLHVVVVAAILTWPGVVPVPEPSHAVEIVFAPPPMVEPQPVVEPQPQAPPVAKAPPVPVKPSRPAPTRSAAPSPEPAAPSELAASEPAAAAPAASSAPAAGSAPAPAVAVSGPVMPDTPPAAVEMPRPTYPRMAKQRGWQGLVVVAVEVNELGCANTVTVKQSSGHAMLDDAAIDAARRWHFRPARKDGRDITASVEVPVRFSLSDA